MNKRHFKIIGYKSAPINQLYKPKMDLIILLQQFHHSAMDLFILKC